MKTQNPIRFALLAAAASLVLCMDSAHAQGGVPLWTNRYDGPANTHDQVSAVAVDRSGNVFVTGYSTADSSGNEDYATIKYSNAGVPLWTNRYDGPANGEDTPHAIAVDGAGNVFVTGHSKGSGTGWDVATIKYSSAGVPLWTNRYDGLANDVDYSTAIAVDTTGNVFVTGLSWNGIDHDYVTLAYSNSGVPLWTNLNTGPGDDSEPAIAVDGNGNVFITGSSSRNATSPYNFDFATIKYSNGGVLLWTNRYNGPQNLDDFASAIVVDSTGNVFVTGYSATSSPVTAYDCATVAYSNSGVPLWTNRYNGPRNGEDHALAIAVDGNGNVIVTGSSTSVNDTDYTTIKYSGAGAPVWTNRYDGPAHGSDGATAIVTDSSGNIFVTGTSFDSAGNTFDYSTIAYSSAGVPLWTNRFNGYNGLSAIAVDGSGNVFVVGTSAGTSGTGGDFVAIKYSSSVPLPRLDFQKLNNQLVLSWTNAGFNLQTAPAVTGPFTNLPAATSPYTNPLTAPQQFFRLISN